MADDCSNPLSNPVGCAIGSIAQGELEKFAQQLMQGANDLWTGFYTSWVGAGLDGVIGGTTADWFRGVTLPIHVFLLAIGLMVAGIRIALSARGDIAADAAKKFLRAILVAIAGVAFFSVLQIGSNALAKFILHSAQQTEGTNQVLWDAATFSSNVAMQLLFGLLGALSVGIQWIIMLLRAVAVSVLLPFWPIAAAGAMFEKQEQMWEKTTGWLLAFVLYSPVAAALYGLAIRFKQGRDGPEAAMVGLAVFALAIFALPALMHLVVPITSAMGRASAGGILVGTAKTAAVATVAIGSAVATAGASAPASAAAAGGSAGAAGATGSAGPAGGSGPGPGDGGNTGSGSASGSSGSGRSGWDSARDLAGAIPSGSRGVGEMIDDE